MSKDDNQDYIRQNYRIYPTDEQAQYLNQDTGNCDFVWNALVAKNNELYKTEKKFLFFYAAASYLIELKEKFPFLKLGNSQALQSVCKKFDETLKRAIKNIKLPKNARKKIFGFPTFRSKRNGRSSNYPQHVKFENNKLRLPKIKSPIKLNLSGQFLPTVYKSVTIMKKPSGKWFISIVVPTKFDSLITLNSESRYVGVDLNSKDFAVTSDGEIVKNPKHLSQYESRLKRYKRRHSKKEFKSKNREKARIKVAKYEEFIANSRKDFVQKTAIKLLKENDCVFIEDLNVAGMQKFNGRMILQAPFGMFKQVLTSKAKMLGKHVIKVNRYFPSSKTCSCCGNINKDLKLGVNKWTCSNCGTEHLRDINAAINILNEGIKVISTVGTTGIKACGANDLGSLSNINEQVVAMKQETTRSLA